jgi:hypothetical protein
MTTIPIPELPQAVALMSPVQAVACACSVAGDVAYSLLAVTLLDPSGADMALHRDANMVRAIVGTRHVKFLSGLADSQG